MLGTTRVVFWLIFYSYVSLVASQQSWILSNFFTTTVISQISYLYKGAGRQTWDGVEAGGHAAGGGLYHLIGLFGVSMNPRSASHRPNKPRGPKVRFTNTGVNIRPIPLI